MEMANGEESQNFTQSSGATPVDSSPGSSRPSERSFSQSEVNELVGRAKTEAVDRYRRESSLSSHQNQSQQPQYQTPYREPPIAQPQHNGMSQDEYRRLAAEEIQKSRQQWIEEAQQAAEEERGKRIANEFLTKLAPGKQKYEDFDEKVEAAQFGYYPALVQLANMVDNTDDVVYELASNPTKMAMIQGLVDMSIRSGAPATLAVKEIQRLSESIKQNRQAANFQSPKEPLTQLRPSTNAGADNRGVMTAADYRKRYMNV